MGLASQVVGRIICKLGQLYVKTVCVERGWTSVHLRSLSHTVLIRHAGTLKRRAVDTTNRRNLAINSVSADLPSIGALVSSLTGHFLMHTCSPSIPLV